MEAEVVDVHQRQRQLLAVTAGLGDPAVELVLEGAVVGQVGQAVQGRALDRGPVEPGQRAAAEEVEGRDGQQGAADAQQQEQPPDVGQARSQDLLLLARDQRVPAARDPLHRGHGDDVAVLGVVVVGRADVLLAAAQDLGHVAVLVGQADAQRGAARQQQALAVHQGGVAAARPGRDRPQVAVHVVQRHLAGHGDRVGPRQGGGVGALGLALLLVQAVARVGREHEVLDRAEGDEREDEGAQEAAVEAETHGSRIGRMLVS